MASKLNTWDEIATRAGYSDPFEPTSDLIKDVMAVLNEAGYRPAETYLNAAKIEFASRNGIVCPSAQLAYRQAVRACKRGLGPAKHMEALPLPRLAELPDTQAPLVRGGPLWPRRFIVVTSWWLLREIEAAAARLGNASKVHPKGASLNLLVSKSDPTALGQHRSHVCTCEAADPAICPACALDEQVLAVQTLYG